MSNRHSHKKITEYSGKPIGSSELLEHTLDIYRIQHLLETEQTSWLISIITLC
jgi:hypothetical protein